jgi:DNA polymerase-1
MYKLLDEYQPDYMCVAFDPKKPTFRHEQYKEYKAGRAKAPDELVMQFSLIREILDAHQIKHIEFEGYEADDISGTLAKFSEDNGMESYLVTSDKDYLQLVTERTKVLLTKKGVTNVEPYDSSKLMENFGINAEQFVDLKALMGDASDNIPGVKGVGEKTGLKLIKEFGSLDGIYENVDLIKGKLKDKLVSEKNQAYMSRELSRIITDLPLEIDWEEFALKEANREELVALYTEYEFRQFMNRFEKESRQLSMFNTEVKPKDQQLTSWKVKQWDADEIIKKAKQNGRFGIKLLYQGERALFGEVMACGLVFEAGEIFYTEENIENALSDIQPILTDKSIKIDGHDIKDELLIMKRFGIELNGIEFDTMVAKYLLEPSENSYDIDRLAFEYINEEMKNIKDHLGSGRNKMTIEDLTKETRQKIVKDYLKVIWLTRDPIERELMETDMESLLKEVEIPLIYIMADMEFVGFKIDETTLNLIGEKFIHQIDILERIVYEMAGETFNLNSPKQLGKILFEKMNLPVIKKTKTGYSTDVEVLEKLKQHHPIIQKIIEYRQLSKLNSTYVEGLKGLVNNKTHRVHSSFKQTITSTGRISSTDPNLQNIPVKTEEGKELRKVFIPEEGYVLVDADYSQIELRVLAHLSDDENLIDAFANNEDIHTKTAAQVFHVEEDSVTSLMRSRAKAVNFGIVYGISDYGLSRDLDIPRKESKAYIENYLEFFKGVSHYMGKIISKGKKDGYVETIFGRRRYLPELTSRNFNIRSFGERLALNTPVQGTAADIIKKAMINVNQKLKEKNLKSRLILQVHDELIVEASKEEASLVKDILKTEMEKAANLKVPLVVDISVGDSWYETK